MSILQEKKEFPIAYKWTITENALRRAEGKRTIKTAEFYIDSFKCSITLKPQNGKAIIGIQLNKLRKSIQTVECEVNISVDSARYQNGINQRIRCKELITTSEEVIIDNIFVPQKRFIVKGKLILKVKGILSRMVPIMPQKFINNDRAESFWNDDVKDFTIAVGGTDLQCHKIFLRVFSPVFKAMLENENLKEARENRMEITDFTHEIVEIAVKLFYGFYLPDSLTVKQAFRLLQFFDKYQIDSLKAKVEQFLDGRITPANVCEMANAAITGNSKAILDKCESYLHKYADEKTAVSGFDELDADIARKFNEQDFWTASEIV